MIKNIPFNSTNKYLPHLFSVAVLMFSFIMVTIIFPYTSWRWDVDFLLTKQHIIHLDYYRFSFYAHIFSSLIILISGAFLFSNFILKNYAGLHRWMGKTYVGLLLLVSAPSGMVMAFHANGGWIAQTSFLILTPLWWWFTYQGYITARQKKFKAHRIWMVRSYALTFSAVSLRLSQMLLGYFFMMDPVVQYILVSWGSWIGNLLIAECWLRGGFIGYQKSLFLRYIRLTKIPL
jgi:hypothetical protein